MISLNKQFVLRGLIFSFFGCFIFSPMKLVAQGNLLVYPKRMVFEGSARSKEISLSNNGNDTARYVISFVQIRMKEDGSTEIITQPDSAQQFADKNIRFFPRNVVLAPGEAQVVKFQLIKANELETGEYRSHVYIRSESEKIPIGDRKPTNDSSSLSIRMVPVFGISVPLIIKVGESTAKVTVSEKVFQMHQDSIPLLNLKVVRTGNMSVYGDIQVDHVSPSGKITRVGFVQGVAIYTPTAVRYFQIELDKSKKIDYHNGKLHITYSQQLPKSISLAETQIGLL